MTPRRTLQLATGLLALASLATPGLADPSRAMEQTAVDLYKTLTPDQRTKAVLPFDDPQRTQEMYTGGPRAGVQIRDLSDAQRKLVTDLLTSFTSDYGRKKAEAVAAQETDGLGQYYVAFFGTPGPDASYAWRIAEHHLTLINVNVDKGRAVAFGPILLGANPPTLWNEEEDHLIALYASLTPDERSKVTLKGRADAARPMKDTEGVPVSQLSPAAQAKVAEVFDGRLRFYSPHVRARVEDMVKQQGGLAAMRVAFWGKAEKRCADGGRWDFKLGGSSFVCDYENTRGHIHLSMKGRADVATAR